MTRQAQGMAGLNWETGIAIVLGAFLGRLSWALANPAESFAMTQTTNRFFDEIGRLMNDAAGAAQGVKREVDTVMRSQAERILRDLDVVQREEFEAVKEIARLAREENEALNARIAALEARFIGTQPTS